MISMVKTTEIASCEARIQKDSTHGDGKLMRGGAEAGGQEERSRPLRM